MSMAGRHANPEIDGDRLRDIRIQAGLTITEAAARAGMNRQYLSQLELGTRVTTAPHTLKQICAVYCIPIAAVMATPSLDPSAEGGGQTLFTLQQAARKLGIPYSRLDKDCRAEPPRVEHVFLYGKYRMTQIQIDALIAKKTVRPAKVARSAQDPDERDRHRAARFTGRAA